MNYSIPFTQQNFWDRWKIQIYLKDDGVVAAHGLEEITPVWVLWINLLFIPHQLSKITLHFPTVSIIKNHQGLSRRQNSKKVNNNRNVYNLSETDSCLLFIIYKRNIIFHINMWGGILIWEVVPFKYLRLVW